MSTTTHTRPEPAGLDSFETALLTELRTVVTQRAEAKRPRRAPATVRRLRLAAAAGLVAVAGGAAALSGGSPAFAVSDGADGAVVIRIHDFTDADGLEAALAAQGVDAEVEYSDSHPVEAGEPGVPVVGDDDPTDDLPVPDGYTMMAPTTEPGEDDPAGPVCGVTPSGGAPIALAQDGDDFVVTLAGPTIAGDNDLRLATLGGDPQMLVADYDWAGGTCGLMTEVR